MRDVAWLVRCAAIVAVVAASQTSVVGQKYRDPDSPEVRAAAIAALSNARVLDIVGVTRGIEGALKDLGAKVSGQEIRIALSADVLFDFDSYSLRDDATASLGKVADVLAAYPTSPVLVEGHTDGKGTDEYNQTLSQRRAESVKNWLVDRGHADGKRIATKGWGRSKPVAPNTKPDGSDDPDGRQRNRRVEIVVRKLG